jgi:hypothetical protein
VPGAVGAQGRVRAGGQLRRETRQHHRRARAGNREPPCHPRGCSDSRYIQLSDALPRGCRRLRGGARRQRRYPVQDQGGRRPQGQARARHTDHLVALLSESQQYTVHMHIYYVHAWLYKFLLGPSTLTRGPHCLTRLPISRPGERGNWRRSHSRSPRALSRRLSARTPAAIKHKPLSTNSSSSPQILVSTLQFLLLSNQCANPGRRLTSSDSAPRRVRGEASLSHLKLLSHPRSL